MNELANHPGGMAAVTQQKKAAAGDAGIRTTDTKKIPNCTTGAAQDVGVKVRGAPVVFGAAA